MAHNEWYTEEENHAETGWNNLQETFTNSGYREGITAGKENALQEGFDEGFASIGAPLGRQLGTLRGTVNALQAYSQQPKPSTSSEESMVFSSHLRGLSQRLARIRLTDLAPRDLQAEAHAREHRDIEAEGTDDALAKAIMELDTSDKPNGAQELAAIQEEVQAILQKLGFEAGL
ncbi:hypothetical protein M408DRAFT_327412 [Serendipita vermifera MAFF 305830]|uniref:Protein YAE1 n=1 Tax=Serendipita vermifera MAFF 305830 TaxID=933852 RepID=A0A0C3BI24_SERVB|nr:hypothetical protein M408DRAFT_327412 [Serendipita vermifera MAFF 305830]